MPSMMHCLCGSLKTYRLSSIPVPMRYTHRYLSMNLNRCKNPVRHFDAISCLNPFHSSENFVNRSMINITTRHLSDEKYPKHKIVKLPSLSPTMETGTIVSWDKNVGDPLEDGDVIAQIETDKAVMAMETPYSGYLAKILIPAGTCGLNINEPIAVIVAKKNDIPAFENFKMEKSVPKSPSDSPTSSSASPISDSQSKLDDVKINPTINKQDPKISDVAVKARIFCSPLAKNLSNQYKVNIKEIQGTGPNGRIIAADVLRTAECNKPTSFNKDSSTSRNAPQASYEDIPITNMRKVIASRLVESKQSIPHYYISSEICMDRCLQVRQKLNEHHEGVAKLSVNDFVLKAASLALMQVPECNSSWLQTHIRRYHNADISVAVSTDTGLITPILFSSESMGLIEINQQVKKLAEKARSSKLSPNEFQGGSFCISNLGMFGVDSFCAVINPPQSCILAVGACKKIVGVDEKDQYFTKTVMNVTLSCDHRVVDGAVAAKWLQSFKRFMEEPSLMLS